MRGLKGLKGGLIQSQGRGVSWVWTPELQRLTHSLSAAGLTGEETLKCNLPNSCGWWVEISEDRLILMAGVE